MFPDFGVARLLVIVSFKSLMKSYGVTAQLKPLWQTFAQRYLSLRTLEMNIFLRRGVGGGGERG